MQFNEAGVSNPKNANWYFNSFVIVFPTPIFLFSIFILCPALFVLFLFLYIFQLKHFCTWYRSLQFFFLHSLANIAKIRKQWSITANMQSPHSSWWRWLSPTCRPHSLTTVHSCSKSWRIRMLQSPWSTKYIQKYR